MSTNAEKNHLADVLDAAKGAREYVGSSSKEEFRLNQRDRDSVNYKFIVIGEAVNRLGKDFQAKHPNVP